MNPFIDDHQDKCILEEPASMQHNGPIAYLNFDLKKQQCVFIDISMMSHCYLVLIIHCSFITFTELPLIVPKIGITFTFTKIVRIILIEDNQAIQFQL